MSKLRNRGLLIVISRIILIIVILFVMVVLFSGEPLQLIDTITIITISGVLFFIFTIRLKLGFQIIKDDKIFIKQGSDYKFELNLDVKPLLSVYRVQFITYFVKSRVFLSTLVLFLILLSNYVHKSIDSKTMILTLMGGVIVAISLLIVYVQKISLIKFKNVFKSCESINVSITDSRIIVKYTDTETTIELNRLNKILDSDFYYIIDFGSLNLMSLDKGKLTDQEKENMQYIIAKYNLR